MSRVLPVIDNSGSYVPIGSRQNVDIDFETNRSDENKEQEDAGGENLETLENKQLIEKVGKEIISTFKKEKSEQNIILPEKDKELDQFMRIMNGEVPVDQLADKRTEYHIDCDFDYRYRQFWQNHEGTKAVALYLEQEEEKTTFSFMMYDYRFCEVYPCQKYQTNKNIVCSEFSFSPDEKYMILYDKREQKIYLSNFENGFENDIFINRNIGQDSIDKLQMTKLKFDQEVRLLRISDKNHLFFQKTDSLLYKLKDNVYNLINKFQGKEQDEKILKINEDYFNESFQSFDILKIDCSFIVGYEQTEKIFRVYNYDEEQYYSINKEDQNLLLQEEYQKEKPPQIIVNLIFNEGRFNWYFFFFMPTTLYIFSITDERQLSLINKGIAHSFNFKKNETKMKIRKIISLDEIICQDHQSYFYKIDIGKNQLELKNQQKIGNSHYDNFRDLMKQSNLFLSKRGLIYNYYNSPFENFVFSIAMNKTISDDDRIVGINCFGEILFQSDLISYASTNFKLEISKHEDIRYFSKRLNLYICWDNNYKLYVKYLKDGKELLIKERSYDRPKIKSVKIEDKEVLRLFKHEEGKKIILYSFQAGKECDQISWDYQEEKNLNFIHSYDSDEIAVINEKGQLIFLTINEKNQFLTQGSGTFEQIGQIKIDGSDNYYTRFLHRILISGRNIIQFSEDYSTIKASIQLGQYIQTWDYFQSENYLIIQMGSFYHIFDLDHKKIKLIMMVKNYENSIEGGEQIEDYRCKKIFRNYNYILSKIPFQNKRILRRIKIVDKNLIFGIPISIAVISKFVSLYDMKSKFLYYHPQNPEGSIDIYAPLTCIQLKFSLDQLTEYQDIGEQNQLIDRQQAIIDNIKHVDSTIINLIGYNVLYDSFSLNKLLESKDRKINRQIFTKIQLISDQDTIMPFLMYSDIKSNQSPLQLALDSSDNFLVNQIMDYCIVQDKFGLLYSDVFSGALKQMKMMGIDLKPLFASSILFHKIDDLNTKFDEYGNFKYCITHSNKKSLYEVLYDDEILDFEKNEENKQALFIEYYVVNMKDEISYQQGAQESEDQAKHKAHEIIKLIDELSNRDLSYLEIELLQVIINFKWKKYTFRFFLIQFQIWLLFILSLIIDITFCIQKYEPYNDYVFYFTRGFCQFILLGFFIYELIQQKKEGKTYFSSLWNISDLLLHLVYVAYIFISFLQKFDLYLIKSIQTIIVCLSFVKLLFFLRIFKELSFLIHMLLAVFSELKVFILFFGIVIGFFTIIFAILLKDDLTNYDGLGPVGYFIIAMRESIGDFDTTDSITSQSDYKILIWIIYLMVIIVGNVIFMNFIIAVVSQSYDSCMQKSTAHQFKIKLHMIKERESIMSLDDYKDKEKFPNFIILCKPISEGANAENMENEWNGVLREMEKAVIRQIDAANQQQKKITNSMNESMKNTNNDVKKFNNDINNRVEQINKKIDDWIEKSNNEQNNRMEKINNEQNNRMEKINTSFSTLKDELKELLKVEQNKA